MTKTSYLGGLITREAAERLLGPSGVFDGGPSQPRLAVGEAELFLDAEGEHLAVARSGRQRALLRGFASPAEGGPPTGASAAAEAALCHYRERGELPIDRLEGSYTLALLDGEAGRVLLYRNLVGTGFTYYAETGGGLVFGGNLADLVDALGVDPRPNRAMLPAYFLYRYVPGHETLFEGVYRLMPGELIVFESGRLRRSQHRTLGDLEGPRRLGREAVDLVDETLGRIVDEGAGLRPRAAGLLSGGVDSTYLQALWNRSLPPAAGPPRTFSVSVDHPRSWPDTEYALSAAAALGTRHTLVPADAPYATYLLETIAGTGEPPNHVQAAYFGHMARVMVAEGITTGVCGEAGDGVFGLSTANQLQNALALRTLVPLGAARRLGASVAAAAGLDRLRYYFRLADRIDDLLDPEHPVNRQAAFADWPAIRASFGEPAVTAALAYRRALLEQYRVPPNAMVRLHASNFLTSSMDSASLWVTLFNRAGGDLFCPFLDSRLLRLAANIDPRHRFPFRRPKELLKRGLARHVGPGLAYRKKLGFGQPIFEWLAAGGQLRPLVDRIADYDFVDRTALAEARARPNWFLYSLLCYDLWHKLFIERTISRDVAAAFDLAIAVPSNDPS